MNFIPQQPFDNSYGSVTVFVIAAFVNLAKTAPSVASLSLVESHLAHPHRADA